MPRPKVVRTRLPASKSRTAGRSSVVPGSYMPLHIYQQAVGANDWPFAGAISVVFMIAVLIIVGILSALGRKSETYARV